MPKGKASRRTLRVTSLFFGSVKRNREKVIDFTHSALRVRVSSTVERRGDGRRKETFGIADLTPGRQFASHHLQQDSLFLRVGPCMGPQRPAEAHSERARHLGRYGGACIWVVRWAGY